MTENFDKIETLRSLASEEACIEVLEKFPGGTFVSPLGDGRRAMDKEFGWFHACSAFPVSDLAIKIPIL